MLQPLRPRGKWIPNGCMLDLHPLGALFAVGVLACCASEDSERPTDNAEVEVRTPQGGLSGGTVGTDDSPSYACTGTPSQPCYCRDGQQTGTQTCVPGTVGATVGPCGDCEAPTTAQSTGAPLCAELRQQAGCKATTYRSEELPASVLFLVDRSGSMRCNAPPLQASADCGIEALDDSMPSKWDITVEALGTTFNDLAGSQVNAALSFFSVDGECDTGVDPAVPLSGLSPDHAGALSAELSAQSPDGRTPIVSALINAYQYMHWEARAGCAIEPCGAPGNRFVVLLTDGSESCASLQERERLLTETAPQARSANIRTFVIGAPGSEPARGFLSELAYVGGTAKSDSCEHGETAGDVGDCHFDMTETTDFAADLGRALGDIGGSVGCSFAVTGSGRVNVQYTLADGDPVCVPQSADLPCEGGAEGWQFAKNSDGTEDTSRVSICGSACDAIRSGSGTQVDVVLGCMTLDGPD